MESPASTRKTRVFVVDDERNIADMLGLILRSAGFLVSTFYNGKDADEHAQQETPDIVLSDIVMPDMDGITLALRLREKHPHCQILLVSGNATTFATDVSEMKRNGGPELKLLDKPVAPETIIRILTAMSVAHA